MHIIKQNVYYKIELRQHALPAAPGSYLFTPLKGSELQSYCYIIVKIYPNGAQITYSGIVLVWPLVVYCKNRGQFMQAIHV